MGRRVGERGWMQISAGGDDIAKKMETLKAGEWKQRKESMNLGNPQRYMKMK